MYKRQGWQQAMREDRAIALGLNTYAGEVTCPGVAEAFGMPCADTATILA